MEQIITILGVAALFLVRIGIPVLALITLGILIDRWQNKRQQEVDREVHKHA